MWLTGAATSYPELLAPASALKHKLLAVPVTVQNTSAGSGRSSLTHDQSYESDYKNAHPCDRPWSLMQKLSMMHGAKRRLPPQVHASVDKRTYLEIKVAKQQTMDLGGCLKRVSSERQYTSAKKKSKQEREESRQEFAETKVKKKATKNPHKPEQLQLNSTEHLDSVQEESNHEDEYDMQDETFENGSSTSLRTPITMLIYFTQIKAVTPAFTQLAPGLAGDDPAEEWSILTYVSLFVLFTILFVGYLTYKLGRVLERRRQVSDLKVKLRVAQGCNQRHFDSALDDQSLMFDRRIAQLENDLVKAAETNAKNCRHRNEMMEQWTIEQQEAEETDQAFQQCQALLSRCYRAPGPLR